MGQRTNCAGRIARALIIGSALLLLCAACDAQRPPTPPTATSTSSAQASTRAPAPSVEPLPYVEEVVGDAPADAPLPLLVLIHGRGDRPQRGWLPLELPVPVRVI